MLKCLLVAMVPLVSSAESRVWQAKWIGAPDCLMQDWQAKEYPAPIFRTVLSLTNAVSDAALYVCGLGYFHCRIDGAEFSDVELCPAPTQYDRRWRYRRLPLPALAPGGHELRVEVGDGLYRCATPDSWHFDKATWLDYPKLICEVVDGDGRVIARTDRSWQVCHGPTVHTALRGGETYDARREESLAWMVPRIVPGPGGVGEEETMPPCRVRAVHAMRRRGATPVYDAGLNLSGVPRVTVRGRCGAKVTVTCGELLASDGMSVDNRNLDSHVKRSPDFQRDVYVLKGDGVETWRPRFTYHGFRYAHVAVEGEVTVERLEALEINTDFRRIGSIETSDRTLMAIERKAMQAVRSNFVGIPTDCPHREKNGWLSEARLQNEALLYECDAESAVRSFVATALDAQRPGGQLPGMAPTSGWGYAWGSGPAWESGPFLMAEQVCRFAGRCEVLACCREALRRNLVHQESMCDERGVIDFGLGDWMAPEFDRKQPQCTRKAYASWAYPEATNTPPAFVATAFYKRMLDLAADIEERVGGTAEAEGLRARARRVSASLLAAFGIPDTSTGCALALAFDLVEPSRRAEVAARLVTIVRANRHRVDYGTLGSGCVLRMLFENGYADDAYRMMVQPDYPGYGYFAANERLTTFPESWSIDGCSENHGAFADVVACMYRYLAGIRHVSHRPGRDYVEIAPCHPKDLADFSATHDGFRVSWKRKGTSVSIEVEVPAGKSAGYRHADGRRRELPEGRWTFVESQSSSPVGELSGDMSPCACRPSRRHDD